LGWFWRRDRSTPSRRMEKGSKAPCTGLACLVSQGPNEMARSKPRRQPEWFHCPNCGEAVRLGAKACPHCGSDEETGWRDEADGEPGLEGDLADDFNYDEYLKREFSDPHPANQLPGGRLAWVLLALALAGLIASAFLLV